MVAAAEVATSAAGRRSRSQQQVAAYGSIDPYAGESIVLRPYVQWKCCWMCCRGIRVARRAPPRKQRAAQGFLFTVLLDVLWQTARQSRCKAIRYTYLAIAWQSKQTHQARPLTSYRNHGCRSRAQLFTVCAVCTAPRPIYGQPCPCCLCMLCMLCMLAADSPAVQQPRIGPKLRRAQRESCRTLRS